MNNAIEACKNILENNLNLKKNQKVVLIHEEGKGCRLNDILTQAYRASLSSYSTKEILFEEDKAESLRITLRELKKNDVVILLQNVNFRLSTFRIRLEMKNIGVYVIEHTRLLMSKGKEIDTYIKSLTYDFPRYIKESKLIIEKLSNLNTVRIISSDDSELTYNGPFEEVKSNIGELNKTLGSFYPIGEVFTEPKDLSKVNGTILVYGFPSLSYETIIVPPFKVEIEAGCIISHNGPLEFQNLLDMVKDENLNSKIWVREMGFGLNKYIGKSHPLTFISAHERQFGYHISVGLKHGVYRKKLSKSVNQKYHIDLFIDLKEIIHE